MDCFLSLTRLYSAGGGTRIVIFIALLIASLAGPIILRQFNSDLYSNTQIVITRFPVFLAGLFAGKYIKTNKRVPHALVVIFIVVATLLQYYSNSAELKSYLDRYIASAFGIALVLVCVYFLQLIDSLTVIRDILSYIGSYSLELYLLHVTMRNLMNTMKLQSYVTWRYAVMVIFAMALSIALKKMSSLRIV